MAGRGFRLPTKFAPSSSPATRTKLLQTRPLPKDIFQARKKPTPQLPPICSLQARGPRRWACWPAAPMALRSGVGKKLQRPRKKRRSEGTQSQCKICQSVHERNIDMPNMIDNSNRRRVAVADPKLESRLAAYVA